MNTSIINFDSKYPPRAQQYFSSIVLIYDDWNDFHYRTLFKLFYCNESGDVSEIGNLKIYYYHNDSARNENYSLHTRQSLDGEIFQLSNKYCSLGQDLSYYTNLKKFLPNEYNDILKRLNDLAINPSLHEKFIDEQGVQTSLLRFSSATKAFAEASSLLKGVTQKAQSISFSFSAKVPYYDHSIKLKFNFDKHPIFPYRINILIGKNGAGKTQLLTKLANSLSGYTDENNSNEIDFPDGRPLIDKVMSISYSAFDSFKRPPKKNNSRNLFSYVYCGIQSDKGTLTLDELKNNFDKALTTIKTRKRYDIWKDILSTLIEAEHRIILEKIELGDTDIEWSSGQHIIISTITELIANIENESIILFDEPEIHLHPNAIANMMRVFNKLLETFNSFAIFSTHSPIIIQEIPSNYIQILNRNDNILTVRTPDIECFGDNISNIITDIFDVSNVESNYKSIFDNISQTKKHSDIIKLFERGLSLNALIYLKNLYKDI